MGAMDGERKDYLPGHSPREIQRLIRQAQLYKPFTQRWLWEVGISPGMRILDFGCGAGDVSFLLADLVGEHGAVIGIDSSPQAIECAQSRAQELQLKHVSFRVASDSSRLAIEPVDAIIGRFVLCYQPDPVEVLRRLSSYLREGGILAFQEINMAFPGQFLSAMPLWVRCHELLQRAFERAGIEVNMGLKLFDTFVRAGLLRPQISAQCLVAAGPDSDMPAYVAETIQTLHPMMQMGGIVDKSVWDFAQLEASLKEELSLPGAIALISPVVGVWAHKPGGGP